MRDRPEEQKEEIETEVSKLKTILCDSLSLHQQMVWTIIKSINFRSWQLLKHMKLRAQQTCPRMT